MEVKRLAIFVIYDQDGILDDFRIHILKELRSVSEKILVVCNGQMLEKEIEKIRIIADEVYIRENIGLDVEAYKDAICTYIGWKEIRKYEELILINDTFYGPFIPLREVFDSMKNKCVDFWGLTAQEPMKNCFGANYEQMYLPYHINSYFLIIRGRMLKNERFVRFWSELGNIKDFSDAVVKFELNFTSYFEKYGFSSGTYVDIGKLCECSTEYTISNLYNYTYLLISKYHCPILKRKIFTMPFKEIMNASMGEDIGDILTYIDNNTEYDIDNIWKHLIRILDPTTLNDALKLRYVLPRETSKEVNIKENEIAVIAHLNYPEQIDEGIEYLSNLPKGIDIIVTTKTQGNYNAIMEKLAANNFEKYFVIIIEDKGREIRGMLVECNWVFRKYKYVCFIHDKRTNKGLNEGNGKAYRDMLLDNMLKSKHYISNVINLLEREKFLGLLVPPAPFFGNYFRYIGKEWTCNFEHTKQLAEKMNMKCVMTKEVPPLSLGTTFWCKTKALLPLFTYGFCADDFEDEPLPVDGSINHAIERIFAFSAQNQGYATGVIMNDEYAGQYMKIYRQMITSILQKDRETIGFLNYSDYLNKINNRKLQEFIRLNIFNYIYGAGDYAIRMTGLLAEFGLDFDGYIVSDGYKKSTQLNGKPIYELSEIIEKGMNFGIIIALDKKNQQQVLPALKNKGFTNIFLN